MTSPWPVGKAIDSVPVGKVSLEILRSYAAASGDHNPIHQDEGVAKKSGLPGVIAHGMLIAGWMSERIRVWLKVESNELIQSQIKIEGYKTRFRGMTFVGDTVFVGGVVADIVPNNNQGIKVKIDLQAKNQKDEVLVTGTLVVSVEKSS